MKFKKSNRLILSVSVCLFALLTQAASATEFVVEQLGDTTLREDAKLLVQPFDNLVQAVKSGVYGDIRTILVLSNDILAFQMYAEEYSPDSMQNLYSMTKSILSLLVGIAISCDYLDSIDQPLVDFFPEYVSDIVDQRIHEITLRQALTMTAGFKWREEIDLISMILSADWPRYVLTKPLSADPGVEVQYNSGLAHLVAEILFRTTGRTPEQLAVEWLFTPLGISRWMWEAAPNGVSCGGWGLHLNPYDLLKIGKLCLNVGMLGDTQVVPQNWIEASIEPLASIQDCYGYGYYWWTYAQCYSDRLAGIYLASGVGEQFMWIVPHSHLVIVVTAWNNAAQITLEPMLWEHILPAVVEL